MPQLGGSPDAWVANKTAERKVIKIEKKTTTKSRYLGDDETARKADVELRCG